MQGFVQFMAFARSFLESKLFGDVQRGRQAGSRDDICQLRPAEIVFDQVLMINYNAFVPDIDIFSYEPWPLTIETTTFSMTITNVLENLLSPISYRNTKRRIDKDLKDT